MAEPTSSRFKKNKDGTVTYQKQPYESRVAGDTALPEVKNEAAVTLYASMLQSPAWMNLSGGARALYPFMKLQAFSKSKNKGVPKDERLADDEFYFNKAIVMKVYKGLYTSMNTFYRHKQELIDNGFITCIYHDGSPQTKDIYKLSSDWQKITEHKPRKDTSKATEASMKARMKK